MADEINNPSDKANLEALRKSLGDATSRLGQRLAQAEEVAAKSSQTAGRAAESLARTETRITKAVEGVRAAAGKGGSAPSEHISVMQGGPEIRAAADASGDFAEQVQRAARTLPNVRSTAREIAGELERSANAVRDLVRGSAISPEQQAVVAAASSLHRPGARGSGAAPAGAAAAVAAAAADFQRQAPPQTAQAGAREALENRVRSEARSAEHLRNVGDRIAEAVNRFVSQSPYGPSALAGRAGSQPVPPDVQATYRALTHALDQAREAEFAQTARAQRLGTAASGIGVTVPGAARPPLTDILSGIRDRLTSGGGGGGGGGGTPPSAPPGGPEGPDPRRLNEAAAAEERLNQRVQEATRIYGTNRDALRAHGLLTTEFIEAAARGQTTFRELGYQAAGTIAKFGGWASAATLVYAAFDAVRALGDGAIESVQGVNLLQRVVNGIDTDKAQHSFRQLATEFNLPMREVVATSYEAAKAFKNQDDALKATRAALFAVKVGELDAAKAGQFSTAVVRGFHLEAGQLADVIDVLNNLQNKFGGNFGQLANGMAAAAGAFGSAKGNFRDLGALLATGTQVTGRSGAEIATALRRTSEIAFRPERRANILDVLGVDTKTSTISDVLNAAFDAVRKGMDPLVAGKLISTPELTSRAIGPILRSEALYRSRLAQTTPDAARGSAERERRRAVASTRDEISKVGVQLQVMGSNLAEAGALNALVALLKAMSGTLKAANTILDTFNKLPEPVREAAIYFGEIAAAMALLRRFNFGASLKSPEMAQLFGRRPEKLERAQVLQGLGYEKEFLQRELGATGQRRGLIEYDTLRAQQDVRLGPGRGASEEQMEAATARRDALVREGAELERRQSNLQERLLINQRQTNNFKERTGFMMRQSVEEAAKEEDIHYRTSTLDRGVPAGVHRMFTAEQIAKDPELQRSLEGAGYVPHPDQPGAYVLPPGPVPDHGALDEEAKRGIREKNTLRGAYEEERGKGGLRGADTRLGRAMALETAAWRFQARAVKNLGASLRSFGSAIAEAVGPFEFMLGAFLVAEASYSYIRDKIAQTNEAVDRLNSQSGTGQSVERLKKNAQDELDKRSPFEAVQDAYAAAHNWFIDHAGSKSDRITSPNQQRDEAARRAMQEAEVIGRANAHGVALTRGQISERLNAGLKDAGDNQKKITDAFDQAYRQADVARGILFASDPEALEKAKHDIETYKAALRNRRATLLAVQESLDEALRLATDAATVKSIIGTTETNIGAYGYSRRRARDLGKEQARQIQLMGQLDRGDPNYVQNRADALANIEQTRQDAIDNANKRIARVAPYGDPDRVGRVREREISKAREALIRGPQRKEDSLVQSMLRRQKRINDLQTAVDAPHVPAQEQTGIGGELGSLGQMPAGALQSEEDKENRLKAMKAAQANDKRALEELRKQMKLSKEAFADFMKEQQLAQYELEQTAYEATTGMLSSRTADPVKQANIQLTRAQHQLEEARAKNAAGLIPHYKVAQAEEKRNQAQQNAANQELQRLQSQQGLEAAKQEAGGASERTVLEGNLARAKSYAGQVLARVRKGTVSPDTYTQALTAVYQAQIALNNLTKSDADGLLAALEALALSKTEDPIKQANIKVDYARRKLAEAQAHGTQTDQINAQAELNNTVRDRRNTIQQERFNQIEFESQLEVIGKSTEIARLEALLRSIKGNRDLQRQIRLRIHELKKSTNDLTSDDLTLGNIRLPTPYEVNRAIKEGRASARQQFVANNRMTFNFNVRHAGDVPAVVDGIDYAMNTSVASSLRFARR